MKRTARFCVTTAVITALCASHAYAQNSNENAFKSRVLVVNSDMELEGFGFLQIPNHGLDPAGEDAQRARIHTAARRIRKLTLEILGGMIYGYTFSYTPHDAARNVKGQWEMEPVGMVFDSDDNLSIVNRNIYNQALYLVIRYDLSDAQVRRMESWYSVDIYPSQGKGIAYIDETDPETSVTTRVEALYDAVREAVRARLRLQLANKPKHITGVVRLSDTPLFTQSGLSYSASVKVNISVKQAESYDNF